MASRRSSRSSVCTLALLLYFILLTHQAKLYSQWNLDEIYKKYRQGRRRSLDNTMAAFVPVPAPASAHPNCVVILGGAVNCALAPAPTAAAADEEHHVDDVVEKTLEEMVLREKKFGHVEGEPQAVGPVGLGDGSGEGEGDDEVERRGAVVGSEGGDVAPVVLPKTFLDRIARPHFRSRIAAAAAAATPVLGER